MKNLINFVTLLLVFYNVGFSQQTFFTLIHDEKSHIPHDILIKPDGNILFCSYLQSSDTSWSSLWELDQWGEIVNEWTFTNTSDEFLKGTRLIRLDEYIYLFGEGQKITQESIEEFVSMRKFDDQLNLVEEFSYQLTGMSPTRLIPVQVIYRDSSFHIFTYVGYGSGLFTSSYFKISSSGNQFHSAFLPSSSGQLLLPYDFYLSTVSDNLFSVCLDGYTNYGVLGVFTEFDTAMNIVSQFPLQDDPFMDFNILGDTDTTFYAITNSRPYGYANSMVCKYDLDGNVLQKYVYESHEDSASCIATYNALDTLPDGNLLLCTTWNLDQNGGVQLEPTKIMFFKLSPDLELIWQRYLFGDDGMYQAWGMQVHPDGGIVVLGTFARTPPLFNAKEVFFMKTDSMGLLTGVGENNQQIKTTEAILYPNPARDIINIEFSMIYHKATFSLTDISGKTALVKQLNSNRQSINISSIPAGTYIYRIFNKDGLDERGKILVE
jgi:hypothetical protein